MNKTISGDSVHPFARPELVTCQEERSQLQNRDKAMDRLKTILAAKAEEDRMAELSRIAGAAKPKGMGRADS